MSDLGEVRSYYETTDMSDAVEGARLESDPADDLLVSTSIRLSKRTLDQVRALAKAAGVPATTLMREWIETRVAEGSGSLILSVSELERFIAANARRAS